MLVMISFWTWCNMIMYDVVNRDLDRIEQYSIIYMMMPNPLHEINPLSCSWLKVAKLVIAERLLEAASIEGFFIFWLCFQCLRGTRRVVIMWWKLNFMVWILFWLLWNQSDLVSVFLGVGCSLRSGEKER